MIEKSLKLSRRSFIYGGSLATVSFLQSCATPPEAPKPSEKPQRPVRKDQNSNLYIFAPSGFSVDVARLNTAFDRLTASGFYIINRETAYRRFSRFSGNDFDRANDLESIAKGKIAQTPKLLLGLRGGAGAIRILTKIDWINLAAKLRESQALVMGYSDVCAIQLALLSKGKYPSFAGPMLYSDFGSPNLSEFTVNSFINGTTQSNLKIQVNYFSQQEVNAEGIFWGGNLSILSSLAGSEYMPKIEGGILFLEDVSEQPYRIERMLQTLYLSGVLQKQKAIIFGDFNMGKQSDVYDSSYNFATVLSYLKRLLRIPVLTNFPFGHIKEKACFPLGVPCKVRTNSAGYEVLFSQYPTLNASSLNLNSLLNIFRPPAPVDFWNQPEEQEVNPDINND